MRLGFGGADQHVINMRYTTDLVMSESEALNDVTSTVREALLRHGFI